MNVTGYQLIKTGDYYYLSIDRARLRTTSTPNPIQDQLKFVALRLDNIPNGNHASLIDSPGK